MKIKRGKEEKGKKGKGKERKKGEIMLWLVSPGTL